MSSVAVAGNRPSHKSKRGLRKFSEESMVLDANGDPMSLAKAMHQVMHDHRWDRVELREAEGVATIIDVLGRGSVTLPLASPREG